MRSINAIIKTSAFRCVICGEQMLTLTRAVPCFSPKRLEREPPCPAAAGGSPPWSRQRSPPQGAGGFGGGPHGRPAHLPAVEDGVLPWSPTGSGEVTGSHGGAGGGFWGFFFFCNSRLALPCLGVSCFSYIVAWESCVTVKRVTISLSELLPSRCRVLESSQQTSTADTLPTCSFSHPSTCTYLNNQKT